MTPSEDAQVGNNQNFAQKRAFLSKLPGTLPRFCYPISGYFDYICIRLQ